MSDQSVPTPPTNEIGHGGTQPPPWNAWISEIDEVPALQWPSSVATFHRMRTDTQLNALTQATTLPIRRRRWVINPNGARDEAVEMVSTDMGLPIKGTGEDVQRRRRRFNHDDHLRMSLLSIIYGHMFFEQDGEIDADDNWRLQKLAPRMPQSISNIEVAKDGMLEGIRQHGGKLEARNGVWGKPELISVDRLVAYVWEQEGANWTGRSMYRPCYRHWVRKDRLLRIDAQRHEKYGLGVAVGTAPQGSKNVAEYGRLAGQAKADPNGGVGLPYGATLGIQGINGTLPDIMGSIRYDDEAMARNFLGMVMQLGQTETGSRALGQTFSDLFSWGIDAIAEFYAKITSEHVIEDIIDWNFGVDENAPTLTWEEAEHEQIPITDLVMLIDKGIIAVDEEVDSYIRDRFRLPEASEPIVVQPPAKEEPVVEPGEGAEGNQPPNLAIAARIDALRNNRRRRVAAAAPVRTGPGWRDPSEVEVRASTDFAAMEAVWEASTADLVDEWLSIRAAQIAALEEAVRLAVAAGNPAAVANISAPVMGDDLIYAHMMSMMEDAIAAARVEAAAQGVSIGLIDVASMEPMVRQQAEAISIIMSRALGETATRQAMMRYGTNGMDAESVAAAVRAHLEELSDTYLVDMLGGALTQAQNTGRYMVFDEGPVAYVYASELLDMNTCERCKNLDGKEYATVAAAKLDYPTGGYKECLGGPRCRGTLVAVYEDESEPTQ